ncbi:MAG: corrinoid protein [Candidatus Methanomethylicia archaeon]
MSEDLYAKLRDAVVSYDVDAVVKYANEVIAKGLDPLEAIEKGLAVGARIIGDKFDRLEIYLAELIMAADAIKAGLDILLPAIPKGVVSRRGVVVIGTAQGDIHEIGKNIVAALLKAYGFDVYDLGVDVPPLRFIEKAEEVKADIIAISALMTSTIIGQRDVIEYLKALGKRDKYIVMVGGGPVTREWAEEIGADGWAETASEAVQVALTLKERR